MKRLHEMEELKRFQGSTFDTFSRRKLIEDRDTILELASKIQELEERRILQEELWRQKLEFREAHQQNLTEMEELRKFQSSTFDTLASKKLIEGQNPFGEFQGRVQELQNEVNCMNDSRDFQDVESVRSGQSHVTSQPVSIPPHTDTGGMQSRSL